MAANNDGTPEEIARRLGLPSSAVAQMRNGEIVTKESDATNEKDLSLIIAVLLNSDVDSLYTFAEEERVHEIQDAMLEVGELDPTNPSAGLEAMKLTEDMVTNLMKNPFLSKAEAHRVKDGLKHKKGAQVYKEVLAERAKAYWAKGLEGIEPYEGRGRDPGADLKAATAESLKVILDPNIRQEIQAIPSKAPHPERHSLTYGIQQGNDMAAPILCHKIRIKTDKGFLNVNNQFYGGQDKDSSQILAGLVPTDDGKCFMFYVNHTFSSAVSGFGGGAKRSIGRKIMKGKLMETMKKAQALKL